MSIDSNWFWVAMFAAVLSISVLVTTIGRWCLHGPAVPHDLLNRLRVGMSMREVRDLLGEPRHECVHSNLPEWRFGHRMKSFVLIVRFDEDGNVRQFQHVNAYDPKPHEAS